MKYTNILVLASLILVINCSLLSNIRCLSTLSQLKSELDYIVQQPNFDLLAESIQKRVDELPQILTDCGYDELADEMTVLVPPKCTKAVLKETKLARKIMKLYSEDPVKNEKIILANTAIFETFYKMQVQKACPLLKEVDLFPTDHHQDNILLSSKDKGECAEGLYRLSLKFEQLDNDLLAGKFNTSLTDMGDVVKQLPLFLDSCNRPKLANLIRFSFPDECLSAIGALVRELVSFEHHYTHFEWLSKHLKEVVRDAHRVKAACPAIEHL